jgi:hypothetical protein
MRAWVSSISCLVMHGVKHCFELSNQIQRSARTSSELVFGVDFVEGDTAEAGANGRVKINCDPLL